MPSSARRPTTARKSAGMPAGDGPKLYPSRNKDADGAGVLAVLLNPRLGHH